MCRWTRFPSERVVLLLRALRFTRPNRTPLSWRDELLRILALGIARMSNLRIHGVASRSSALQDGGRR